MPILTWVVLLYFLVLVDAELRLKLNKIMASQYLTAAPVGLQAATMNYGAYQAPVHESVPPVDVPVQVQVHVEDIGVQYQQKVCTTYSFLW